MFISLKHRFSFRHNTTERTTVSTERIGAWCGPPNAAVWWWCLGEKKGGGGQIDVEVAYIIPCQKSMFCRLCQNCPRSQPFGVLPIRRMYDASIMTDIR